LSKHERNSMIMDLMAFRVPWRVRLGDAAGVARLEQSPTATLRWRLLVAGGCGLAAVMAGGLAVSAHPSWWEFGGGVGDLLQKHGAHELAVGAAVVNTMLDTFAVLALLLVAAIVVISGTNITDTILFVLVVACSWAVAWGIALLVDRPGGPVTNASEAFWFRGLTYPSRPVTLSAALLAGILIITRRPGDRVIEICVGLTGLAAVVWARLYLGLDYPLDAAAGIVTGVATTTVCYSGAAAFDGRRHARGRPTRL
ncbi:MAG TPA: phosphatase PAP2 family protein, partial [Microbacteriaceae bacterium]|nr:phosphatase PAP2 family protein [Microbacteriaceae bacterium]